MGNEVKFCSKFDLRAQYCSIVKKNLVALALTVSEIKVVKVVYDNLLRT